MISGLLQGVRIGAFGIALPPKGHIVDVQHENESACY